MIAAAGRGIKEMPRYYFDCEVDGQLAEDEEGLDLPSLEAVEGEALHSAMAIACDEFPPDGRNGLVTITARDEHGQSILTVRSSMTTTIEWNSAGVDTRLDS